MQNIWGSLTTDLVSPIWTDGDAVDVTQRDGQHHLELLSGIHLVDVATRSQHHGAVIHLKSINLIIQKESGGLHPWPRKLSIKRL